MIALLLRAGKLKILVATAILVVLTSLADWLVGRNVSLAALYIVPMMLGAVVLGPMQIALLAVVCSYLRSPSPLTLFQACSCPAGCEITNWSETISSACK